MAIRNTRSLAALIATLLLVTKAPSAAAGVTAASSAASLGVSRSGFQQRLMMARTAYFKDLQGDHEAHEQARNSFAALAKEEPGNAAVQAYLGSLDLLDAARTWAVWNKHELSLQGLRELDTAVDRDPSNLEARFIRAATDWHLPFFFHRREQAEDDFAYIAPRAADAVANGALPPQLGAAALDYYGQLLSERSEHDAARDAYLAAVRMDHSSPAGLDASRRLKQTD